MIKNMRRQYQRGEIATIATLIGLGIMVLGIAVGNRLLGQRNEIRSKAQSTSSWTINVHLKCAANNMVVNPQTTVEWYAASGNASIPNPNPPIEGYYPSRPGIQAVYTNSVDYSYTITGAPQWFYYMNVFRNNPAGPSASIKLNVDTATLPQFDILRLPGGIALDGFHAPNGGTYNLNYTLDAGSWCVPVGHIPVQVNVVNPNANYKVYAAAAYQGAGISPYSNCTPTNVPAGSSPVNLACDVTASGTWKIYVRAESPNIGIDGVPAEVIIQPNGPYTTQTFTVTLPTAAPSVTPVPACAKPGIPQFTKAERVYADANGDAIHLQWTVPIDTTDFILMKSSDNGQNWGYLGGPTSPSADDGAGKADTVMYKVQARHLCADGTDVRGDFSTPTAALGPIQNGCTVAPAAPTWVSVSRTVTSANTNYETFDLRWSPVSGATSYRLEDKDVTYNGPWIFLNTTYTTTSSYIQYFTDSWNVNGIHTGVFHARVSATNACGTSSYSTEIDIPAPASGGPSPTTPPPSPTTAAPSPTTAMCQGVQHCADADSVEIATCTTNTVGPSCSKTGYVCTTYSEAVFASDTLSSVPCNGMVTPPVHPTPTTQPVNSNSTSSWYAQDGSTCDTAHHAGSNYAAFYTAPGCTGSMGFAMDAITPQSACSTDGSGACFIPAGDAITGNTYVSTWMYNGGQQTSKQCISTTASPTTALTSTVYRCTWSATPPTTSVPLVPPPPGLLTSTADKSVFTCTNSTIGGVCKTADSCHSKGDVVLANGQCPAGVASAPPDVCCLPRDYVDSMATSTFCKDKTEGFYKDASDNTCYQCAGRLFVDGVGKAAYGSPTDAAKCVENPQCDKQFGIIKSNNQCYDCLGTKYGESYGYETQCPADLQRDQPSQYGNAGFSMMMQLNNLGTLTSSLFKQIFSFFTRTPGQLYQFWKPF